MADLVRTAMPDTVADKVVGCRAWPALARRLGAWTDEGLPVADLLADLPAGRVFQARTPAAYTAHLMDLKVAAHRTGARAEHGARTRVDTASRPSPAEASAGRSAGPAAAADAADTRGSDAAGSDTAGPDAAGPDRSARTSPDGRRLPGTHGRRHLRRCSTTRTSTCSTTSTTPPPRPARAAQPRRIGRERAGPGSPRIPRRTRPGPRTGRCAGIRAGTDESWVIGDSVIGDSS